MAQPPQKRNNISASWSNILTSVILRIAVSIVSILAIAERTLHVYNSAHIDPNHIFLLGCGWVAAILTLVAHMFTLIGVLQDRDL